MNRNNRVIENHEIKALNYLGLLILPRQMMYEFNFTYTGKHCGQYKDQLAISRWVHLVPTEEIQIIDTCIYY